MLRAFTPVLARPTINVKSSSIGDWLDTCRMYEVTCSSMRCNLSFRADWSYAVCPRCGRSCKVSAHSRALHLSTDGYPSQDDYPSYCLPARHSKSLQSEPPFYWWPDHTPHSPPRPPRGLMTMGCLRSTGFSVFRIPRFPRGMFVYYPENGHSMGRWVWHAYNILYNF